MAVRSYNNGRNCFFLDDYMADIPSVRSRETRESKVILSMYHINDDMQGLTESPLYHTVTIINNNTHSSGVSLQLTKKKRYVMFYAIFFLKMRNIP